MALGDSITAGFGAMGRNAGISKMLNEFRGLSFADGADTNTTSVYAAFRHYNPKIAGGSLGNHLLVKAGMVRVQIHFLPRLWSHFPFLIGVLSQGRSQCRRVRSPFLRPPFPNRVLNLFPSKLSGIALSHLLCSQLKKVMKTNFSSLALEWKYANLFIGANDVCSNCAGML